MPKTILVVDEDAPRRKLNAFGLRCAGFSVDEAAGSSDARSRITQHFPHLVLFIAAFLDFTIQDFVRSLRSAAYTRELPVVALVEREGDFSSLSALEWGIDDYLLEPVSPEHLVARVRATIDGATRAAAHAAETLGLSLDGERGGARLGTSFVALGPTEQRLLEFFLTHPDQLIPRELLLFRVWGGAQGLHSRVLDVSVCRLRRALGRLGCQSLLQTVSRHGYRFASQTTIQKTDLGAHQ
jgi:DNA-binding response OmpR family regulator